MPHDQKGVLGGPFSFKPMRYEITTHRKRRDFLPITLYKALCSLGLAQTHAQVRRLVKFRKIKIDGEVITNPEILIADSCRIELFGNTSIQIQKV